MTSLIIGYPHGREVAHVFMDSMIRCIAELPPGLMRAIQAVGAGAFSLDRARNEIVERFLATDAEWLLQIDTDMKWAPQDVLDLLKTADRRHRPVVGALCFKLQGMNEDYGAILIPTLYRKDEHGETRPVLTYKGVERVDATGAAFLLIHRDVLTKMGGNWFSHHPEQETASEDWAFSLRLRDAGFPLHVDTRIRIGHEKAVVFGEPEYRRTMAAIVANEGQPKEGAA